MLPQACPNLREPTVHKLCKSRAHARTVTRTRTRARAHTVTDHRDGMHSSAEWVAPMCWFLDPREALVRDRTLQPAKVSRYARSSSYLVRALRCFLRPGRRTPRATRHQSFGELNCRADPGEHRRDGACRSCGRSGGALERSPSA